MSHSERLLQGRTEPSSCGTRILYAPTLECSRFELQVKAVCCPPWSTPQPIRLTAAAEDYQVVDRILDAPPLVCSPLLHKH